MSRELVRCDMTSNDLIHVFTVSKDGRKNISRNNYQKFYKFYENYNAKNLRNSTNSKNKKH